VPAVNETGSPSGEGTFEYGLDVIVGGVRASLRP